MASWRRFTIVQPTDWLREPLKVATLDSSDVMLTGERAQGRRSGRL